MPTYEIMWQTVGSIAKEFKTPQEAAQFYINADLEDEPLSNINYDLIHIRLVNEDGTLDDKEWSLEELL